METLPKNPIFEYPSDTLQVIREMYNLDKPGRMSEAIDILEQWAKKQNHFVKTNFSKKYLETAIINSKGSIERAKRQIDSVCTSKTLKPIFFSCYNVSKEMENVVDLLNCAFLPKLTNDYNRVYMWRFKPNYDFTSSNFLKYCQFNIALLDYTILHDYCAGYILVNDYRHVKLVDVINSVDFLMAQEFSRIITSCYGTRVKAIVYVTTSKFIENFTKFIKPLLNEKMAKRLYVCNDLEALYEIVPKDLLPTEYGGKEKSIDILHDNFLAALSTEEHVEYITEMSTACTDESRRQTDVFNEQYMGMPGTFRTLNVD